jgi:hypothetical protein
MDYRNYRGESPVNLPPWLKKHMYKLRPIGTGLLLFGAVGPFLMVIKAIPSSFVFNAITYVSMFLGGVAFLVGLIFDNLIDRSE